MQYEELLEQISKVTTLHMHVVWCEEMENRKTDEFQYQQTKTELSQLRPVTMAQADEFFGMPDGGFQAYCEAYWGADPVKFRTPTAPFLTLANERGLSVSVKAQRFVVGHDVEHEDYDSLDEW